MIVPLPKYEFAARRSIKMRSTDVLVIIPRTVRLAMLYNVLWCGVFTSEGMSPTRAKRAMYIP